MVLLNLPRKKRATNHWLEREPNATQQPHRTAPHVEQVARGLAPPHFTTSSEIQIASAVEFFTSSITA
jgi:hypothetical protein